MNKLMSVIAVVFLLTSGAHAAGEDVKNMFIPMTFEEYNGGDKPIADTSNTSFRDVISGASSSASVRESDGGKSLELYASGKGSISDNSVMAYLYRPFTDRSYVSMDLYADYKFSQIAIEVRANSGVYARLIKVTDGILYFMDSEIDRFLPKKWHNITFMVDNDKKTTALYFNGNLCVSEKPLGNSEDYSHAANQLRMNFAGVSGKETVSRLDNLVIYSGGAPVFGKELLALQGSDNSANQEEAVFTKVNQIKKSLVFMEDSNKVMVFGMRGYSRYTPYMKDDKLMLPLSYTANIFGAYATESEEKAFVYKNGRVLWTDNNGSAFERKDGIWFAQTDFYEQLGVHTYENGGVVIIGKDDTQDTGMDALVKDLAKYLNSGVKQ